MRNEKDRTKKIYVKEKNKKKNTKVIGWRKVCRRRGK